jgi:hypothetical protein
MKGSVICERLQELLNCLVEHFHLDIALRSGRGFCMSDIQNLKELNRELVYELLATVPVYLRQNSELQNQSL